MRLRAPGGMIRVLSTHRIHTFNLPASWRCSAKDSSSKHQSLQAYSLDQIAMNTFAEKIAASIAPVIGVPGAKSFSSRKTS